MPELWRTADIQRNPLADGTERVVSRYHGATVRIRRNEADLLESCRSYLSLERHASNWVRGQELASVQGLLGSGPKWLRRLVGRAVNAPAPEKRVRPIIKTLETLARAGLMVRRSSFVEECSAVSKGPPPSPIETIGLTTRNRPEALERALRSYAENAQAHGRNVRFVIVDDARAEGEEQPNRELATRFRSELGVEIRYLGGRERRDFCDKLCEISGVEREIVEFCLFGDALAGVTTGAARNTLLLANTGNPYILVDDDSVCLVAATPGREQDLAISSSNHPTEFWYYRNRDETFAQAPFEEVDFLGLHESLLGWEVGPKASEQELDLTRATPEFERLLRTSAVRVRGTMAGILGDSGVSSSAYLFHGKSSRERLLVSEEFYRQAVSSRQVLRAVSKTTVARALSCMAGNLGLDSSELLPPFVPVQRNSDGLFARVLKSCFPTACLGYFPCAAMHDPLETRMQSVERVTQDLTRVRFADVARVLIPTEGERDLATLGQVFLEAATGSIEDFEKRIRGPILDTKAKSLHQKAREGDRDLPRFYVELREQHRQAIRDSMGKPEYLVPRDLLEAGLDEPAARQFSRHSIERFGRLLSSWPRLWRAAEDVRK